jgi:hypothetical protein
VGAYVLSQNLNSLRAIVVTVFLLVAHIVLSAESPRGKEAFAASQWQTNDKYKRIAALLQSIPGHDSITVASSDAGVIPYYAGVRHLDLAGLNTTAIARAENISNVLKIVKDQHPEIILIPVQRLIDSCYRLVHDVHGKIKGGYDSLAFGHDFTNYNCIAILQGGIYDLAVKADSTNSKYTTIYNTIRRSSSPAVADTAFCLVP